MEGRTERASHRASEGRSADVERRPEEGREQRATATPLAARQATGGDATPDGVPDEDDEMGLASVVV
jgi:hypothetical protein